MVAASRAFSGKPAVYLAVLDVRDYPLLIPFRHADDTHDSFVRRTRKRTALHLTSVHRALQDAVDTEGKDRWYYRSYEMETVSEHQLGHLPAECFLMDTVPRVITCCPRFLRSGVCVLRGRYVPRSRV